MKRFEITVNAMILNPKHFDGEDTFIVPSSIES